MSHLDTVRNVIHARVLYWGPAGAGKTSTLRGLRRFVDPEGKARLYSLHAADGSTTSFDMLPLEEFTFGPHRVRVRVFAAPGGADLASTRLALLRDVDAVMFVADASRGALAANQAAMEELQAGLDRLAADPAAVPVVFSVNKQDQAEAQSGAEFQTQFLGPDVAVFETIATSGDGVFSAFTEAFRQLMGGLVDRHGIAGVDPHEATPSRLLPQLVRGVLPATREQAEGEDCHFALEVEPRDPTGITPQLGLAEAHVGLDAANRLLQARNRELMAVNRVARSILSAMEADNLLVVLLDATADHLNATHASCVVFDPTQMNSLRTHVLGFGRDPALGLPPEAAREFLRLLQDSDGPVPFNKEHNPALLQAVRRVDRRVRRALFQPIKNGRSAAGWLGIYSTDDGPPLSTQALLFLSSISRLAALGLEKIALLEQTQRTRARLEAQLKERTGELELSHARIRALNRGLESRVTERTRALEEANRSLREAKAGAVHSARLRGMGAFATSFAHEVQRPIATLNADLDRMRETIDELRARVGPVSTETADALKALEEFDEVIERSRQGAHRIANIITSLKRFGDEERAPATLSVNAALADAVTLLEERIESCADLDLRLGTLPEVKGASHELSHVVLSVLTNAVEAIERKGDRGRIEVTTYASGDQVTLMVKDTGSGIDPQLLPRVFEPFVSTKDGEQSAGLGLHCAYRTVQRHDGSIRVRSKPGEGTTVTVLLPTGAGAERQPEPDDADPTTTTPPPARTKAP